MNMVAGYHRARRGLAVVSMAALLLSATAGGLLADGTFGKARKITGGDGYNDTFAASTYAITVGDPLDQVPTGRERDETNLALRPFLDYGVTKSGRVVRDGEKWCALRTVRRKYPKA